jgi:thioredoxin reductase (NADPH)
VKQPNVAVYGSTRCPDTVRACRFLDGRDIPYEFKDVDETPDYNDYIAGLNGGKRVMPTIRLDNHTLINPSEEELAKAVEEAAAARG